MRREPLLHAVGFDPARKFDPARADLFFQPVLVDRLRERGDDVLAAPHHGQPIHRARHADGRIGRAAVVASQRLVGNAEAACDFHQHPTHELVELRVGVLRRLEIQLVAGEQVRDAPVLRQVELGVLIPVGLGRPELLKVQRRFLLDVVLSHKTVEGAYARRAGLERGGENRLDQRRGQRGVTELVDLLDDLEHRRDRRDAARGGDRRIQNMQDVRASVPVVRRNSDVAVGQNVVGLTNDVGFRHAPGVDVDALVKPLGGQVLVDQSRRRDQRHLARRRDPATGNQRHDRQNLAVGQIAGVCGLLHLVDGHLARRVALNRAGRIGCPAALNHARPCLAAFGRPAHRRVVRPGGHAQAGAHNSRGRRFRAAGDESAVLHALDRTRGGQLPCVPDVVTALAQRRAPRIEKHLSLAPEKGGLWCRL